MDHKQDTFKDCNKCSQYVYSEVRCRHSGGFIMFKLKLHTTEKNSAKELNLYFSQHRDIRKQFKIEWAEEKDNPDILNFYPSNLFNPIFDQVLPASVDL